LNRKLAFTEALVALRKASVLLPNNADAHFFLGTTSQLTGANDEAERAFRRVILLQPDRAEAHCNLGQTLSRKGQFAEALAACKRGDELGSRIPRWPYQSQSKQWVRDCEHLVELDKKLSAAVQRDTKPADAAGWVELFKFAKLKRRPGVAARLYEQAFAAKAELAQDLVAAHRYEAACAAACAGCGLGMDAAQIDEKERAHWRRQALTWLRADLAQWTKLLDRGDAESRSVVQRALQFWERERDLAGLRDPAALARLPKTEEEAWRMLWADVKALLARLKPTSGESPPK
jgi:Tfp pilus assembly protein PilF